MAAPSPSAPAGPLSVERRAELLAAADPAAVRAVADALTDLAAGVAWQPTALSGPEVGMVVLEVREPVAEQRFHLAEVLVTRAEVTAPSLVPEAPAVHGWSVRMGAEPEASWAAAVCDAAVEAGHPRAEEVLALCARTAEAIAAAEAADLADLAATQVTFEELDR